LIPDYMDCKYFAGKPVATNNFGLCFAAKQKFYQHSLATTFFHMANEKNFSRQLAPAENKLISDPEGRCKERGRMHSTEYTICSFDRRC